MEHVLTYESGFSLRVDNDEDDSPPFELYYCRKFTATRLDVLLNLHMFLLVEDVTFAFEHLHPTPFVPGPGVPDPAGGDCELACRIDTDNTVIGARVRRALRYCFRDMQRAIIKL